MNTALKKKKLERVRLREFSNAKIETLPLELLL
jgi:hypothetical protein